MGLFSKKKFESMDDLLLEQLEDLYDAENRITKALPMMAEAAGSRELTQAFKTHLKETEEHIARLEQAFESLGHEPKRETCEGIKGLIDEGNEMISAGGDQALKDAALIAAAQRVEHYEMAGYGTARTMAEYLGHAQVAKLLQKTLNEEGATDKKLTQIAEGSIYKSKAPGNGRAKVSAGRASANGRKSTAKRGTKSAKSSGRSGAKKRSRVK